MSHPNLTTNIHNSSGYAGGAAQIPQANAINDSLVPIRPRTSTVLKVTPEALPKSHRQMILMTSLIPFRPHTSRFVRLRWRRCPNLTGKCNQWQASSQFDHVHRDLSGYVGGSAQIPQANANNDKSYPNSTTNIHNFSGYAGGAAQIPQANKINGKSCPNSTTNIHHPSSYAGGAAQIPQANNINDRSSPNLTKNIHNCSAGYTEFADKYVQWQVSSQFNHDHPHFFRLCRRRPNSTDKNNQCHGMVQANVGQNRKT